MAVYLQGSDPTAYGVAAATAAQIQEASLLIDSFLDRPEGLIYDALTSPVMDNTQQPIETVIQLSPRFNRQIILDRKPVSSIISVSSSFRAESPWTPVQSFNYIQNYGLTLPYTYANQLIKINYVAGWIYSELPFAIKQACANIINSILGTTELSGNILSFKMGDGQVARKDTSHLSSDTKALLRPWKRVFAL